MEKAKVKKGGVLQAYCVLSQAIMSLQNAWLGSQPIEGWADLQTFYTVERRRPYLDVMNELDALVGPVTDPEPVLQRHSRTERFSFVVRPIKAILVSFIWRWKKHYNFRRKDVICVVVALREVYSVIESPEPITFEEFRTLKRVTFEAYLILADIVEYTSIAKLTRYIETVHHSNPKPSYSLDEIMNADKSAWPGSY